MSSDNRITLKKLFSSIKIRFLFYFIAGMIITLALSSTLSYRITYSIIERINHNNSKAELNQIAASLNALCDNIDRHIDTLAYDRSTRLIKANKYYSELDKVYSVNDFSGIVGNIISNFPYIDSVYLYLEDDSSLCVSKKNVRFITEAWDIPVTDKVKSLIKSASGKLNLQSNLSTADFQLYRGDVPPELLISAYKKIEDTTVVINIREKHISSLYDGLASNTGNNMRIIDDKGMIFSSADKTEIGSIYNKAFNFGVDNNEQIIFSENKDFMLIWLYMDNFNITLANEISLDTYWNDLSLIRETTLLLFFTGLSISCVFFYVWIRKVFSPLIKLKQSMQKAGEGNYEKLPDEEKSDELSILVRHFNKMLDSLKTLTENNKIVEEEKRESELHALRNQINPHFLHNTLNTIKWMAVIAKNKNIVNSIAALGDIILPMFRSDDAVHTLKEEIVIINQYLYIMNLRYGGGLSFKYDLEDGLENVRILRFILQPIIENSIIHGFGNNENKGEIFLKAFEENGNLIIEVTDNGTGMDEEMVVKFNTMLSEGGKAAGIGIMNTGRRINLKFGKPFGIFLKNNEDKGLKVTVKLPFIVG